MRTDNDVDAALPEQIEDLPLLTLRSKSAEHFDTHRIIEHSLPKNFEMLLGEHRRRREHCDLSSVYHCLERRSDSHFGFAKPNVATDQPIHRARTFHIDFCVDDRFHLIRRFAKRKGMLEFARAHFESARELRCGERLPTPT